MATSAPPGPPRLSEAFISALVSLPAPTGSPGPTTTTTMPFFTPSHASYESLRATYTSAPGRPALIVRPASGAAVALLLSRLSSPAALRLAPPGVGVSWAVRSGGHDLCGRSMPGGGPGGEAVVVVVDVRDLADVVVSADRRTARVGGGVAVEALLEALEREGLVAPTGAVGSVGVAGWSMLGGYGPLSPGLGLGVDGIVGARVVVRKEEKQVAGEGEGGEMFEEREADEELLWAIRGAGGAVGVVVTELLIKVYELGEVSRRRGPRLCPCAVLSRRTSNSINLCTNTPASPIDALGLCDVQI